MLLSYQMLFLLYKNRTVFYKKYFCLQDHGATQCIENDLNFSEDGIIIEFTT